MVGRGREIRELNRLYNRNHADLVAIYGRRGVGKTFLIDETFGSRITFRHAGLSSADQQPEGMLKAQLEHFYRSLREQGMENPGGGIFLDGGVLSVGMLSATKRQRRTPACISG